MNTPDPRGVTLWEIFVHWLGKQTSGSTTQPALPAEAMNPLRWDLGQPVLFGGAQGDEFVGARTRLQAIRHIVRTISGQHYDFLDYVLEVINSMNEQCLVRVRTIQNTQGEWDTVLLRLHDAFEHDEEFVAVVDDASGIFRIDDDPSGSPAEFNRLSEGNAWDVGVYVQRDADGDGLADDAKPPFHRERYRDFIRRDERGGEEFLFVEMELESGAFELWRGKRVRV